MFRFLGPLRIILAILVILTPVIVGLVKFEGIEFRDNLDFFALMMSSPVFMIFPLLVCLLACANFYQEVGHRFASYKRLRMQASRYVLSSYGTAAVIGFAVFFLFAFVPFALAFWLWPLFGNPQLDPHGYGLTTPQQIAFSSYTRFSYSSLLRLGPGVFGVVYSLWLGFCGAVYACLGVFALLTLRNRVLAVAMPFIVFFVQTLFAALFGTPQLGLAYSAIPFGLQQSPIWFAMLPTLVLALIVIAAAWGTLRSASSLQNLA